MPSRPRLASLAALAACLLSSASIGCGARTCDDEAKEAEATGGAEHAKKVRASCERRVAGMKDSLERDEDERRTEERRNAFINRADGRVQSGR